MNTTIDNKDLLRIILWFCGEKTVDGRVFRSNIRLQKIMFLAQKDFSEFERLKEEGFFIDDELEFEANNLGPFSQDLIKMVNGSFRIEDKEVSVIKKGYINVYKINNSMKKKLYEVYNKLKDNSDFRDWVKEINRLGLLQSDELLKRVYENRGYQESLVK